MSEHAALTDVYCTQTSDLFRVHLSLILSLLFCRYLFLSPALVSIEVAPPQHKHLLRGYSGDYFSC